MTELLRSFRLPEENQFTNIRMSKLDRLRESAKAKTNWSEMAKMLFRNDDDQSRQKEMGNFISPEGKLLIAALNSPAWGADSS